MQVFFTILNHYLNFKNKKKKVESARLNLKKKSLQDKQDRGRSKDFSQTL